MNDDELWAAIDRQRDRIADLLGQLSVDEWQHPSLCPGWTIRDVAAHLTLQQQGVLDLVRALIRNPRILGGGLNRMILLAAKEKAALPTEQLTSEIRGMVGSRRHNVGVTLLETLIDILVHSQDIAIPLQRDLPMEVSAAAVAATRAWSYGGKGLAKVFANLPIRNYRLVATDTDWAVGSGPQITGPIAALLLLITGRDAVLDQLTGAEQLELGPPGR